MKFLSTMSVLAICMLFSSANAQPTGAPLTSVTNIQFTTAIRIRDTVRAATVRGLSYAAPFDYIYLYSSDAANTARVACTITDYETKAATLTLSVSPTPLFDPEQEFLKVFTTNFRTFQECRRAFFGYLKTSVATPVRVTLQ